VEVDGTVVVRNGQLAGPTVTKTASASKKARQ